MYHLAIWSHWLTSAVQKLFCLTNTNQCKMSRYSVANVKTGASLRVITLLGFKVWHILTNRIVLLRWEPWSSGYGRRLVFWRSNPSTLYRIDIYSQYMVDVKIVKFVWKDENKPKNRSGMAHFLKVMRVLQCRISLNFDQAAAYLF